MHRTSLAVQLLGFSAFMAEGPGSISAQGTKILQAVWHVKKKKKKNPMFNKIKDLGQDN